ncbi:SigE family RNA polymerase sigma factor [Micromonospora gifhornensis]|uniref:RNA polymerase sigma24 factor n=1 Tax=Micromonospora gifhornensis TaxID=84594 RepID=A0ABQ4IG29_9ACTN|nr:SigE family RNA polymerase sigma factor [Micromonospora gifhornensis]GIJ16864.1 RNA polymerase sigma24 factor [Micromonospora gifhornensis]
MTPSDERDFTAFVKAHGDRLLRFARLLLPDDAEAEDALQTALLRLTRHWSPRPTTPEAYVRTTLVNLARDRGRRRHLVPVPAETDQQQPCPAGDHADRIAARAHLDELLAALPPRQRITVVLRVLEGRSEAETADLLGCSVGTVKSNLARGLDKIRTRMRSAPPSTQKAAQ